MTPRDDYIVSMCLPTSAAQTPAPQHAPASVPPGAGAVPLCVWLWGCDEPATDHDLCAYHADKCRDIITERDRGDLETEL